MQVDFKESCPPPSSRSFFPLSSNNKRRANMFARLLLLLRLLLEDRSQRGHPGQPKAEPARLHKMHIGQENATTKRGYKHQTHHNTSSSASTHDQRLSTIAPAAPATTASSGQIGQLDLNLSRLDFAHHALQRSR